MKLIEVNIGNRVNYIKFESDNWLNLNDLVYIKGHENYYYEVSEINISSSNNLDYIITAKPAGYYYKLENEHEDIRYIFNSPIIKETDPKVIKKIREESRYL